MAEYKIVQIGWEGANDGMNIVLVSKRDRAAIGTDIAGGVHVKKGETKVVALVERQFRQFVGMENVATINTKLATALGAAVGDIIEIDGEVTESEWAAFEQTIPRRAVHPLEMMMYAMNNASQRRTQSIPRDPQDTAEQVGGHE